MSRANAVISNRNAGANESWRRVDIFWSDADTQNWNVNTYYAPHYTLLEKDGVLKRANAALNLRRDRGKSSSQVAEFAEKEFSPKEFMGSARAPIDELLKEAAKVHARGRSEAVVCTQVSQWVTIRIQTYHNIVEGDYTTFPNLHVWGFLQPASIGGDFDRRERELGWVTDDIPRAGWFESSIIWSQQGSAEPVPYPTPALVRYGYKGSVKEIVDAVYGSDREPDRVRERIPYRLIQNDDGTCTTIQVKVKVVIRNDETPDDRERKYGNLTQEIRKKLLEKGRDEKTIQDIIASVDRYEAGSFLKVWARNLDYCWSPPPTAGHVADDESERCMTAMQLVDSPKGRDSHYTFQNYNNTPPKDEEDTYFRPFSFRNHTWKRNKVVVNPWGENAGSEDAYNRELVYILLLPTEVLEKIDKLITDTDVEKSAKDPGNTWIIPLSVCVSFFVLLSMLRKIKNSQTDKDKFQSVIDALDLPKHAAILASMEPARDKETFKKNFQNPKLHDVFKGDPSSATFTDSQQRLCQFFGVLFKQAYAIALSWGDGEYEKFVESYEKQQSAFWNSKNTKEVSRSLGFGASDSELVSVDYVFREVEKVKKLGGSKLPGYFAWLEWAVLLKLGFKLGAQVKFGKKTQDDKTDRFFLNGSLDPVGFVSLAVELGAVWSMVNESKRQSSSREAWEWAETVKYVLTWVELKLGISLSLKSEGKIGFDVDFLSTLGHKMKAIFNPFLKIDHKLDLDSQIYATVSNLVQINYSALHYRIMHLTGSGVSIGDELHVGGKRIAGVKAFSFVWGIVEAQDRLAQFQSGRAVLGETLEVTANYRGQPDPAHYCLDICYKGPSLSGMSHERIPVFCDEVTRERADSGAHSFPDQIKLSNILTIDESFFKNGPRERFLENLLSDDQEVSGVISLNDEHYKDDASTKARTSSANQCTIATPYVSISLPYEDFSLSDTITLAIVIYDFACKIPLYLWVYEDEDACVYTGDTDLNCQRISLETISGDTLSGRIQVPLGKYRIAAQARNDLFRNPFTSLKANLSFRVSLDPEGQLMLKAKDVNGKLVGVEAVTRRDVIVE